MKVITMYLPQFHRTEINDSLWGDGYTDWVAVKKARKLFDCHDQPRVPIDNNYYDLSRKETMEWQWSLAEEHGIYGFCFYHYYFGNGRKALNEPAENLLKWSDLNMRFCFSWANESWISSWSSIKNANNWYSEASANQEREILIEQIYGDKEEWISHFDYLLPFFKDSRYIRIGGKPVFLIHRPELIPDLGEMIECWRGEAHKHGLEGLYVVGTGSVPVKGVLDACLLSAPLYGMESGPGNGNSSLRVFDAEKVWRTMTEKEAVPGTRTFFGAFADYDDTPRRGENGTVLLGDAAALFRKYLPQIMRKNIIAGNDIQFINAWNEWGEGNYLEPDISKGYGFLESIRDIEVSGEYLTEKEYALRDFERTHSELIGRKVILYGTGANASAVLSRYDDRFHFAGVIDEKKAGTSFCGKRVLSIEEAGRNGADAVIIAAQTASVFSIMKEYGRELTGLRIPLTDLYGNDVTVMLREISDMKVVRKSDYETLIMNSDVISFDLMDCLLRRNAFSPDIPFVSEQVRELLDFSESNGRKIVFTADDSVPVANQEEVLRKAGIKADKLIVESEYGRNKLNGLFRIIKNMYPGKRILHIGNDLLADVIAPRVYGLDSIGVGGEWNSGDASPKTGENPGMIYADKNSLMEQISDHDTVCFDIFDTLITRVCLEPEDVFGVMERTSFSRTGIQIEGFADIRVKAQTLVPHGNLRDIYSVIKAETGIEEENCHALMLYEMECEKELTVPRYAVAEMLEYAKSLGKRTVLVSDMYIPEKMMIELLEAKGINGYDELIISCDRGKDKREGLLDDIQLREGEKVLFVGDDARRDTVPAEEMGFDTFYVPSCRELMQSTDVRSALSEVLTPAQSFLAGTTAAYAFNDPFMSDIDAVLSAYLTISLVLYVSWLIGENRTDDLDGMIFMSRDGRFFKELYDYVSALSDNTVPPSFYLPISRAAAVGLILDRIDISKAVDGIGRDLLSADTVSAWLGVPQSEEAGMTPEEARTILAENHVALTKNAADQRQYLFRLIGDAGIGIGKKYGLFDFFSGGTIQGILEMTMPFYVRGLYYAVNKNNVNSDTGIEGAFPDESGLLQECLEPIEEFICSGRRSVIGYSIEGPVFRGQAGTDIQAVEASENAKRCFAIFNTEMLSEDIYNTAKKTADALLGVLRSSLEE